MTPMTARQLRRIDRPIRVPAAPVFSVSGQCLMCLQQQHWTGPHVPAFTRAPRVAISGIASRVDRKGSLSHDHPR